MEDMDVKNIPVAVDKSAKTFSEEKPFKGYTMEELKYQRAVTALKKEFCKAKLVESVTALRGGKGEQAKKTKHPRLAFMGRVASIVFSNLNAIDYVMMGMSLFGSVKKGVKLFRGRR